MFRKSLKVLCIAALLAGQAAAAQDGRRYEVSITEQPLGSALQALAAQLDLQIVFFSGATRGLTAAPLAGSLTRSEALEDRKSVV